MTTVDPRARRHTPLAAKLSQRIRRSGPLSIADYMHACLQDDEHGYYRRERTIGRDFVTAPEISQVFGELIGLWAAVVWAETGRPTPVHLVELGPGRATLMLDMLRALSAAPDFRSAAQVHLVETSPSLSALQKSRLAGAPAPVSWHEKFATVPPGPTIVVANEFLDALPIRQFVRTARGWAERAVDLDARGELQFSSTAPIPEADAADLQRRWPDGAPGDVAQSHIHLPQLVDDIAARAASAGLVALLLDYGYTTHALGDTLQAVRQHQIEHPLAAPGEADLTVHVDFAELSRLCIARGLEVDGPVTQAEFLGALGIVQRTDRLMAANPDRANAIEMGVQRLMAPIGMGTRVKVMAARSAKLPPLPGLVRAETPAPAVPRDRGV